MKTRLAAGAVLALSAVLAGAQDEPKSGSDYPTIERVQFVEFCIREHSDRPRQEMLYKCSCAMDKIIAQMGSYIDNVPDVVLDYHCDSPVDMERTSPSFLRGDLHGIATTTYQSGSHRPTPELGQYRVPGIDRLYLVGPFQHPGGGVFGAGRATAMVMAEDLGIEFDRIAVA